jgi:fatty-acyl-CoA synthase
VDRGIGSWVTRRAALDGDDVALIEGGTRTTWAEFEERTNRLGHALMTLGVRRGDRIAVLMFNSVTFMETVFAVAKLGAIVVPVNFRLQGPEVAYILADAGADVLVHHDALAVVARTATADPAVRVRHRIEVVAPASATSTSWPRRRRTRSTWTSIRPSPTASCTPPGRPGGPRAPC